MNPQIKELLLSSDDDDIRLATELLYREDKQWLEYYDKRPKYHIPWNLFNLLKEWNDEVGITPVKSNHIAQVIYTYIRENNYLLFKKQMKYDDNKTTSG